MGLMIELVDVGTTFGTILAHCSAHSVARVDEVKGWSRNAVERQTPNVNDV